MYDSESAGILRKVRYETLATHSFERHINYKIRYVLKEASRRPAALAGECDGIGTNPPINSPASACVAWLMVVLNLRKHNVSRCNQARE